MTTPGRIDDLGRIAELSLGACAIVGSDGTLFAANRRAIRLTGTESPDEGRRCLEHVCKSAPPGVLRRFASSSSLTPAALQFPGSDHRIRCYGGLLQPAQPPDDARILIQFEPTDQTAKKFLALNERLEMVNKEVRRRQRAEEELRGLNSALESRVRERTRELDATHEALMLASRKAGMAEVADGVLHNIGNVLNSLNLATDMVLNALSRSKTGNLHEASTRIESQLTTNDAGGDTAKLATYLARGTAAQLDLERSIEHEVMGMKSHVESIRQIVDAQQENARHEGVTERVLPAQAVEQALALYLVALERHEIHVMVDHGYTNMVRTDRCRLVQILTNLIANALDALRKCESGSDRALRIFTTEAEPGHLRFQVEDSGMGIEPEVLQHLFNHGFTTKANGHGFGLHSSALIAHELGGTLEAHSAGAGHGATFTLTIPCGTEEEESTHA